ncbi:MAG: hypothetical protein RLZZ312_1856 [Bacteroidota bacterium]
MKLQFSILFLIFCNVFGHAQLAPFVLNTSFTNETCVNNGTISASTQNTTAGATVVYQIFRLPNLTTPVSTNANTTGLSAADYRVVATQTLITPTGLQSNTEERTVTITNQLVNLSVNITKSTASSCGNSGTIVVETAAGTPLSYEIISGQVLRPSQTSNTFNNLPAGKYQFMIVDNCGNFIKPEFTLVLIDPVLTIGLTSTPPVLSSCTNIVVSNSITVASGATIAYPLTVVFTINPSVGASQATTETILTGNATTFNYVQNLPITSNIPFTYDILITDACGTPFPQKGNNVNPNPTIAVSQQPALCGFKFLAVEVRNYLPPYTLNVLQSPAGFVPANFVPAHPGPFATSLLLYGSISNPTPFGLYEFEVTDACGRKDRMTYNLVEEPILPTVIGVNNGCGSVFGSVTISLPQTRKIIFAEITTAPSTYTLPLPNDVSSFIEPVTGIVFIPNLPIGLYNFTIKDNCGDTFFVTVSVPAFVKQGLVVSQLPNCVFGSSSIKVNSGNGILKNISITSAPSNYNQELPHNVTNNIKNGELYLANLPAGTYSFAATDFCDYSLTITETLTGYNRTAPGFDVQRNCGTFDIVMAETSNGINIGGFWLQRLDTDTNTWQHPTTGAAYIAGSVPNAVTGQLLPNNTTTFNFTATGTFRILKTFQAFDAGSANTTTKTCIDELGQFDYEGSLKITGAYTLDCAGGSGNSSIIIDVVGVAPYNFQIIEKDGLPFSINNGTNNTFSGLAQGTYKVQVIDKCLGKTAIFTLSNLTGLARAFASTNFLDCRTITNTVSTFDLTAKKAEILGPQNANLYNVTFYVNQQDAQNDINPIVNPNFYANVTNPQNIFARVTHKTLTGCYATTSFRIFVGQQPTLATQPTYTVCEGQNLRLTVEAGFNAYLWSTGETTNAISVSSAGDYTVTATNIYAASNTCSTTLTIKTQLSGIAKTIEIKTQDWTASTNSIEVVTSGIGAYQYSIDDFIYQDSNVFLNLPSGLYTVFVKDKNGCGKLTQVVALLNYPNFFTPNGDGYNEFWKIKFSNLEPKLYTYIFDRFGKLITGFDAGSVGWDGTMNGRSLPADDYWFVVNREDGRIYKGHFTLKR